MKRKLKQLISAFVLMAFSLQGIAAPAAFGQTQPLISSPMVSLTPAFTPPVLRGIRVDLQNPFHFNFVLDKGQSQLAGEELKIEGTKLIKYFLASLTLPENDLWVNLSPYEKDRIITNEFGRTEMGRQVLSEDYLLKKLSASLLHPDAKTGKKFWDKVRKVTADKLGTTDIPMETFNRIWIMPDKAVVYQDQGTALIGETHLKVLMQEDYAAATRSSPQSLGGDTQFQKGLPVKILGNDKAEDISSLSTQVFRDEVLPVIEKEVNEGETFASLRQIYHSLILASWYKRTLKQSLLSQVYVDRKKMAGMESDEKDAKEKIYEQYLTTFKNGVYNLIREEEDAVSGEMIPRKYFSGGVTFMASAAIQWLPLRDAGAVLTGPLVQFDINAQGVDSSSASSVVQVTEKEIILKITPYFRHLRPTEVVNVYHVLKQPQYLGEEALKTGYAQGLDNFVEGIYQIYRVENYELIFNLILNQTILDPETIREAFKSNPHEFASAFAQISANFDEFYSQSQFLLDSGISRASLRRHFIENPVSFVKRLLELGKLNGEQKEKVKDLLLGVGKLQDFLKQHHKRLVFEIYDVASLNAVEGFIKTFNVDFNYDSTRRIVVVYSRSKGLTKEIINQRFPLVEPRDVSRGFSEGELVIAFKNGLAFPHRDTSVRYERLSLPITLFKYNLPEATPIDEVYAIRKSLQLESGRKVIVTSLLLTRDDIDFIELSKFLNALKKFPAQQRPLLILGLHAVDDNVREFIRKDFPQLRIAERGENDLSNAGEFNGKAQGKPMGEADVVILNTQNELLRLVAIADLVVIGHDRNFVESISQGKFPIVMAGNWANNGQALAYFKKEGVVQDAKADLYVQLQYYFDHEEKVTALNKKAQEVMQRFRTQLTMDARFNSTVELILSVVESSSASSTIALPENSSSASSELKDLKVIQMQQELSGDEIVAISAQYGPKDLGITPPGDEWSLRMLVNSEQLTKKFARIFSDFQSNGALALAFPANLEGAEVLILGPGREATEIKSFLEAFPGKIKAIHIVEANPRIMREVDIELNEFKKAGHTLPQIFGYVANIMQLPVSLRGQMDIVYEHNVIDPEFHSRDAVSQMAQEIQNALKTRGVFLSTGIQGKNVEQMFDGDSMEKHSFDSVGRNFGFGYAVKKSPGPAIKDQEKKIEFKENFGEPPSLNRRDFLKRATGLLAGTLIFPWLFSDTDQAERKPNIQDPAQKAELLNELNDKLRPLSAPNGEEKKFNLAMHIIASSIKPSLSQRLRSLFVPEDGTHPRVKIFKFSPQDRLRVAELMYLLGVTKDPSAQSLLRAGVLRTSIGSRVEYQLILDEQELNNPAGFLATLVHEIIGHIFMDEAAGVLPAGNEDEIRAYTTGLDFLKKLLKNIDAVKSMIVDVDPEKFFIDGLDSTSIQKEIDSAQARLEVYKARQAEQPKTSGAPAGGRSASSAVSENEDLGGIDLTEKNMNLDLRGQAGTFALPADPAQIQNIRLDGLVPVILNITPLPSLPVFLQLSEAPAAQPELISRK